MKNIGRFALSEITFKRIAYAVKARLIDIPHSLMWDLHPLSHENRENIIKFKDIHNGERCFIVANGPSLQKTDLDLLANEFTFGLNRIYLNFDQSSFRPTYFVTVNSLILEQFGNEISQLDIQKFINWNRRNYFGPPNPKLVYLKSKLVVQDFFQYDLTHPMVFGATVTFVALQLAYYMGFQKVILVGLDHNYSEKGTPSKTKIRQTEHDPSHFHDKYFPKGSKWELPDLRRSEIEFELAHKAFQKDGREILDATIGGKCPIFEKIEYRSLFK